MVYEGTVYRPPSEAYSLIVQATIGCSHNKCSFCYMYKDKKFRIRSLDEIFADLEDARANYRRVTRIFLADGDAIAMKTSDIVAVLDKISELFPECERIGIYASPKAVLAKSDEDLKLIAEKGISIAYLGLESGSDEVLIEVNKGVNSSQQIFACKKLKQAGIKLSVTVLSGLGGKKLWESHASETARAISEIQPDYAGLLTLVVGKGTPLYEQVAKGEFVQLNQIEVMQETKKMLELIDVNSECIFRSNHVSNYVQLRGTLPQGKQMLINQLDAAISNPQKFSKRMGGGVL